MLFTLTIKYPSLYVNGFITSPTFAPFISSSENVALSSFTLTNSFVASSAFLIEVYFFKASVLLFSIL